MNTEFDSRDFCGTFVGTDRGFFENGVVSVWCDIEHMELIRWNDGNGIIYDSGVEGSAMRLDCWDHCEVG